LGALDYTVGFEMTQFVRERPRLIPGNNRRSSLKRLVPPKRWQMIFSFHLPAIPPKDRVRAAESQSKGSTFNLHSDPPGTQLRIPLDTSRLITQSRQP